MLLLWHTLQGFGGNVMKQSGWTKGRGIGRDMAGVSEPIEVEGQSPYCKKGLGLDHLIMHGACHCSLSFVGIMGRS